MAEQGLSYPRTNFFASSHKINTATKQSRYNIVLKIMSVYTEEKIKEAISASRRAGNNKRFEDAVAAADDAINAYKSIQDEKTKTKYIRPYIVALSLKGAALQKLDQLQSSVLALEEAHELLQIYPPKSHSQSIVEKVAFCLVQVCGILGRDPPLPPLVKFPRTPHILHKSFTMMI